MLFQGCYDSVKFLKLVSVEFLIEISTIRAFIAEMGRF